MSNIPQSLRLMNAAEVSNVVVGRQNQTIYPTGGQRYESGAQGGQVIEFKLPVAAGMSVDMSTFYVHGSFNCVAAAGATIVYPEDSLESIIDEVTVFVGNSGQELERIGRGYYRLESALNNYVNSNYTKSAAASLFYAGLSRDERIRIFNDANAVGPVVQFSIPLRLCGSASPDFVLPSYLFGQSSFLIIRIRLAEPAACLLSYTEAATTATFAANTVTLAGGGRTAVAGSSYVLQNVRASYDVIQTSAEYQNQISQFLASQSLVYPVRTWDLDFRSIPQGISSRVENLSYNYRDIEALFVWFHLDSELNSFAFHGEERFHVPPTIQSIQFTINGQRVPSVPIDLTGGASEALSHTITALGALHIGETVGPFNFDRVMSRRDLVQGATGVQFSTESAESGNAYFGRMRADDGYNNVTVAGQATCVAFNAYLQDKTPSYFLIGVNLRKLLDLPPGELSGLNLQNTSGSITYDIKFSSPTAAAYTMGVAVLHNRFISLSGAGVSVDV